MGILSWLKNLVHKQKRQDLLPRRDTYQEILIDLLHGRYRPGAHDIWFCTRCHKISTTRVVHYSQHVLYENVPEIHSGYGDVIRLNTPYCEGCDGTFVNSGCLHRQDIRCAGGPDIIQMYFHDPSHNPILIGEVAYQD